MFRVLGLLFGFALVGSNLVADNPVAYLDEYLEPYYPNTDFPKLTTPQWVGEEGVDAVVTLAIDDMRDTAKYEEYLRPILDHLKKIDGRAPVSIMTCSVDPNDPQLQAWLKEGLSIEVHTVDHPCPCLQGGQLAEAKSTYDRCVDMMSSIEGNRPVAFRTPCCDSRNTPSPRLWSEVFHRRTDNGNFLQADSSVFNVFTDADPALPRELVLEADGTPRMKKYIPFPSFVNTIENYPYPYVIGKLSWQFPCMVPSDWEAQNLHQPNNPKTVEDMKAALDATVIKQGMFNLVFHPHGWIRSDQVIELIDHARSKYGGRVKFLTFRECVDRVNQHLLVGQPLRAPGDGGDNGVRIVDVNQDGFLDVLVGNEHRKMLRIWQPERRRWRDAEQPVQFTDAGGDGRIDLGVRFGRLRSEASVSLLVNHDREQSIYDFVESRLQRRDLPESLGAFRSSVAGVDQGVRLRDLDHDGLSEVIVANSKSNVILKLDESSHWNRYAEMPFAVVDGQGRDNGLRFVDFDHDGHDDVILSNESEKGLRLFDASSGQLTRVVDLAADVPLIVREGTNNGVWFARDHLWVQNEDTHRLPDGVDRRTFRQLLGNAEPGPRSPERSLDAIKLRPGFEIELVAAEPLVMDPIALDWGADGKLWVVEMADYPLGLDDRGKPGGRVRYLEDTNGDGKYDKSTLFLDQIAYPTGVLAWQDGVIVSAAPTLFFAADRDGDGKAEFREDLYRGFGEGNQQHRVNGFERGLDNWLYLANGDSGGSVESIKTGKRVDLGSQDLRIRPSEGGLDLQSGRTQFGRHRDDFGNWFGCSNPLPVSHFVLADHYLRRNPHVAPPPPKRDIARVDNTELYPISRVLSHWSGYRPPEPGGAHRFTSACSTSVYRDDLFGEDFQQNTFTCEPVHNLVHRRKLIPNGVSFESIRPDNEASTEFLASSDSWFRPTTVTTGPDGAIWVVDMYRLVIEHPEWIDDQREKELFLRAGYDRGRIYRVYPTGVVPRQIEKIGLLDASELVDRLESPNGRVRDLAQQLLVQRSDAAVARKLEQMVQDSDRPLARLHALCTLDGMGMIRADTLQIALADTHSTVQRHAIRISEPMIARDDEASDSLLKMFSRCDLDDPQVQLQLAFSLGESSSPDAIALLAEIALRAFNDPYRRAAVISSLDEDTVLDFYKAIAEDQEAVAAFWPSVLKIAARTKNGAFLSQALSELLAEVDPGHLTASKLVPLTETLAIVAKQNVELERSIQEQLDKLVGIAIATASDGNASVMNRVAAIQLVALVKTQSTALLKLIHAAEPTKVQVAAVEAIANRNPKGLLDRFRSSSPAVRAAMLRTVLARESTALVLLEYLQNQQLPLQDMGHEVRQGLTSHASSRVRSAANRLFENAGDGSVRSEVIAKYQLALSEDGNAKVGQEVFAKHCATCHRYRGIGHVVGPDLASLKNRSPNAMLTAILDPGAAVEDKYRSYTLLTVDGIAVTGIISSESTTSIDLRLADGVMKSILREDIELLQSTGKSLMPEQMEKAMSPAEMRDLLAFLTENAESPKPFAGNEPVTVTATDEGNIELTATNCRIFGEQIRYELRYQNVGYWGSREDYVQWSFLVDRPGRYEVVLEYACPDDTAGNPFCFVCGDQLLTGKVAGTGTWDDYRQVVLGTVQLEAAASSAVFGPGDVLEQWLMDMKSITLRYLGSQD